MYVDAIAQQTARCSWLTDHGLPVFRASEAITDARRALVGAKCAKTIYYRAPTLTDSEEDKTNQKGLGPGMQGRHLQHGGL